MFNNNTTYCLLLLIILLVLEGKHEDPETIWRYVQLCPVVREAHGAQVRQVNPAKIIAVHAIQGCWGPCHDPEQGHRVIHVIIIHRRAIVCVDSQWHVVKVVVVYGHRCLSKRGGA